MTHRRFTVTAVLAVLSLAAVVAAVQGPSAGPRPAASFAPRPADYVPGQVLVKFRTTISSRLHQTTFSAYQSRFVTRIPRLNVYLVDVPEDVTVEEMVAAFKTHPDVLYAEPNYVVRASVTPNDPLFKYQYALANTGQAIGWVPGSPQGKASADIKATAAWEETKGLETTIIAVCDTGVDLLHPDLKNKIRNSGKDFVNEDMDATDDHGHGTKVAGIAAAETNNNEGIAGVAWNAKILPVKVLDNKAEGTVERLAQGILWAVDNGASVINLSLGLDTGSETLRSAVKYAFDKNVVVVAAAGSTGGNVQFPAAYDNYVLAVAATDYTDTRADFSNTGSEVDVAAPGVRVFTTVPLWLLGSDQLPYAYDDGTSMAAPHAAGLAALIKGLKTWLTPTEIMDIIRYSADDVNDGLFKGRDEYIGWGRINMEKALVPLKLTKKIGAAD